MCIIVLASWLLGKKTVNYSNKLFFDIHFKKIKINNEFDFKKNHN